MNASLLDSLQNNTNELFQAKNMLKPQFDNDMLSPDAMFEQDEQANHTPNTITAAVLADISQEGRQLASGNSLMSSSFTHTGPVQESQYVSALKGAAATKKKLKSTQDSSLVSQMPEIAAEAAWYGSKKMRNAKIMKDIQKDHKQLFEEMNTHREDKTQEALAPKDAEGNPIVDKDGNPIDTLGPEAIAPEPIGVEPLPAGQDTGDPAALADAALLPTAPVPVMGSLNIIV